MNTLPDDPGAALGQAFQNLGTALWHLLQSTGKNFIIWLIKVGVCVLIFIIARKILKKVISFLDKKMEKRNVPNSVKSILLWLLNYAVTIYIVVQALIALGLVQSASIAALIAAMGVGISLAMQGVIGNFAGGLLLILLKPFKEGDYIAIDNDVEGSVYEIHVYYTTLINVYGDKLRVPNSKLTNLTVRNYVSDNQKGIEIHVGVGYQEALDKPLAVLEELMNEDERIFKEPRAVFVHELGDNAVILGLRCRTMRADHLKVKWNLNKRIRERFAEEGISIPYPQLDVHINPEEQSLLTNAEKPEQDSGDTPNKAALHKKPRP